jgi:hypothetical protein
MEEPTSQTQPKSKDNSIIFYILGGLIITAIIVAGFVLMPKGGTEETPTPTQPVLGQTQVAPTNAPPSTGPIGSLTCTSQFYNTVNGVAENYYLSTEGEVPTAGGQVTCTVSAAVNNQVIASQVVTPSLNAIPARGGATFKCTTPGMKLQANVPVKVTTELKDANGVTASCNRTFLLP